MQKALLRPLALTTYEPILQVLSAYFAFVYGTLYRTSAYIT